MYLNNTLIPFYSTPLTQANSYNNTGFSTPITGVINGWAVGTNTLYIHVKSGNAATTGNTGLLFQGICTYTPCAGVSINSLSINASSSTYCIGSQGVTLTASTTFAGPVNYLWLPGNLTGSSIVVTPSSSQVYTLIATPANVSEACSYTVNAAIRLDENCCPPHPYGLPLTVLTNLNNTTYNAGPYVINGNITLGNSTNFQNSEFLFGPNAKITVPAGLNLNIDGSHLYACGTDMWDGIEVLDGGSVSTPNSNGLGGTNSSLIEDAKIAIEVDGNTASSPNPLLILKMLLLIKIILVLKSVIPELVLQLFLFAYWAVCLQAERYLLRHQSGLALMLVI